VRPGDPLPELRVLPDRHLPHRYASASEDFNPIHIDPEAARELGLPGHVLAPGDPRALKRLSVEFRDMGIPGQEIAVKGSVREVKDGRVVIDAGIEQSGRVIVGGVEAEIEA